MSALGATRMLIDTGAEWTRLGLETAGALTIAIGGGTTIASLIAQGWSGGHASFTNARFGLSRYLALALEFQLAADILETAIAPEWAKIGQLAAIAAIRTALNYFLSKELAEHSESQRATSTYRSVAETAPPADIAGSSSARTDASPP